MAQYNADIRIGVTGKAQLNQLEAQLKRTQVQLNKLNKSLQLRTRVQAIRLDTRAANTAIKQLEQRINRLGRTINVNLRVNEREGRKSQSSGSSVLAVNNPAKQLAVAKASVPIAKALTNEAQALLDAEEARAKAINKLTDNKQKEAQAQKDLNKAVERQRKLQKSTDNRAAANFFGKGTTRGEGLKLVQKEINAAQASLRGLAGVQERFTKEVKATSRAYGTLRAEIKRAEQAADTAAKKAAQRAENRKKFNKGFGTGFGIGAASGVGNIPVLNEAVTGGLVASLSGGSAAAGALGGALAGLATAFVGVTGEITTFNNELNLMRKALANTVSTSEELETAFGAIRGISRDFLVPIGQATQEFTKLNAAARASGFTVEEVEEVYRGLASANVALGGDAERLQGILLATQQVFSKGKVQAEELRGQIGERLAGAFAKFAESAGLSTSELDKALERGEVSLEDFVRFAKSLLDEYEDDAKRLADEPENAAKRLKLSMDDLKEAMGPIVTEIGNQFINMANTIVSQLARAFRAINQFRIDAQKATVSAARRNVGETATRLGELRRNQGTGFGQASAEEIRAQEKLLALQIKQRDEATKTLRRLESLANPKLEPTGKPPGPRLTRADDPSDAGGKSGPRDITAQLTAELALEKELLRIEGKRFGLRGFSGQLRELELRDDELKARLANEELQIATQNITAESKALAIEIAKKRNARDILALFNERAQLEADQREAFKSQLEDLQTQIAIEQAITEEQKSQLRLAREIEKIKGDENLTDDQKKQLEDSLNALERARQENQGISGYIRQLQGELMDTEAMVVRMAQVVEGAIAGAISSAVTGLIDGTTSVEEALSDMFRAIGEAFIQMASEIIAKQLVMIALQSILKALGGASGGGASSVPSSAYGDMSVAGPSFFSGGTIPGYAEGGFVTSPTKAMVGEGSSNEYIIPEDKMSSAMQRYNSGARGEAVIDGSNDVGGSGGPAEAGGPPTINIEGGVLQFNDSNYIRQDQVPAIINQASKQGEAKALRRLQMSPAARRKAGVR